MDTIQFESVCVPAHVITLHELLETYFAKRIKPHGKSDEDNIKRVFGFIAELFPLADTSTFDSDSLEDLQRFLIRKEYDRKYINKLIGFVKSVFKWAKRKHLVSLYLYADIESVPALKVGEALKENPDREDAKPEDIEAVLNHLPIQIAHMLALQALTGLRPSEICNLKAADIDQHPEDILQGHFWRYQPAKHKTSGRGVKRGLALGEQEQAIIKLYLTDDPEKPLFRNPTRYKDKAIDRRRYSNIIRETIEKHKLPKFVPYQVRHTVCTWISKHFDRDHARAQLGHTTTKMTSRYDHSDSAKQVSVLEKRQQIGGVIRMTSLAAALALPPQENRLVRMQECAAPAAVDLSRPVLRIYRGE